MRRATSKRLLNLGRLVSLLGAIGAVGTWAVWTYAPDWVDRVDEKLQKRYYERAKRPLRVAQHLLNKDPEAGIAALEEFRSGFASYRRGDHYFRQRKQALLLLAKAYEKRGEIESAAGCLQEILDASPRDLVASIQRFEVLTRSPKRRAEGIAGLEALYTRLPESQLVADSLSARLAEGGDIERAWQIQLETHRSFRSNRWYVRWKRPAPSLWNDGLHALVAPARLGNRLRLEFSLEPNIRGVGIGLPILSNTELRDMRLSLIRDEKTIHVKLTPDLYELHDMQQVGDAVRSLGTGRPWIEVPLDKLLLKKESHFEFTAEFRELHAKGMRAFAANWMPQLVELLTRNRDQDGLDTLAVLRRTLLAGEKFDLYWRDAEENYSGKRRHQVPVNATLVDGGLRFDLTVQFGVSLRAIRFDAPELIGLSIEFTEFSITSGDRVHRLDLDAVEFLHGMERVGNTVTTTGPDPHLSIALPQSIRADSVRLRGVAR